MTFSLLKIQIAHDNVGQAESLSNRRTSFQLVHKIQFTPQIKMQKFNIFYRRHLPHFQPHNATIFLTFRLANSLPIHVIKQLKEEALRIDFELDLITDAEKRRQTAYLNQRLLFGRWDQMLDQAQSGPTWLKEPQIAKLVSDSIHYLDNKKYALHAYCIMPNHAHLLCHPLLDINNKPYPLSEITQVLKGYTARHANILLNRSGPFWQHESYDHVVRDAGEHERITHYILNNPVKAGLVTDINQWTWSYPWTGTS